MQKNVKIGLVASIMLIMAFVFYLVFNANNYEASFIKEIDPNLTAEQRKIYEDRIAEYDKKLSETDSDSDRFNLLLAKGFDLYGLGSLSEARKVMEEAIKLQPDSHEGHKSIYTVQLAMNDNKGALKSIQKALELNPNSSDIWKKYIQLEIERFNADNNKISSLYSEALVKTDHNIDIVTAYASWLGQVGNYQAAKEYWQRAIQHNPSSRSLYEAEIKGIDEKLEQQQ